MGRHSVPDPEDSADQPSDEETGDYSDPDEGPDEGLADDEPSGRHAVIGYGELAEGEPAGAAGPFGDYFGEQRYSVEGSQYSAGDGGDSNFGYPNFGANFGARPASGPVGTEPPITPPSLLHAGQRGEPGGWQGGHRSTGGRRGVSIGVIVALVGVVVVVAGVILWRFLGDALSHRSHTAAARCVGGKDTVAVIADPSIADQVKELSDSYNASAGPIGDRCVSVAVKPAGSDAVISGFVGKWPGELGAQPGLWIPGSSISAARLAGTAGQKTISDSRSLVTSPVLLAVRPEFRQALANQNWAALPGLQSNPNSLAGLNSPAWGSLRLALPTSGNSDASFLAGEAIATASAPAGAPPTAGVGAVRTLLSGQPKLADDSLKEALNALVNAGDPASAPLHAVITTEQQLFQRGQSLSDAKGKLGFWLPPGPVALADYPTVLLNGSWLSQEQTTAASAFARYMHKPEQLAILAKAGFRVNDVKPPSSPVTDFPALAATLSVGDEGMRATLADTMAAPSTGVAATIMLDQSLPGDDGGKTRLANVIAALDSRIKALPPATVLGLWTFDGHEGRSEVATGPLSDPVNGQPRSAALQAALDKQFSSGGGAVSFTTLRLIYQDMLANFRAGQDNSVLVITGGPHTDLSLDGAGLQDFIRQSANPARPVAVNIIDFGGDPDRATWEAVARLSGGSYQNLTTSASPDLATAVNTFLS
jgi:Bacterial extracellular solute-binding protein